MKNKWRWSEAKISNISNRHFKVQFVPYCSYHAKSFTTHLEVNLLCSKRLLRCPLCWFLAVQRGWDEINSWESTSEEGSSGKPVETLYSGTRRGRAKLNKNHTSLSGGTPERCAAWWAHLPVKECGTASRPSSKRATSMLLALTAATDLMSLFGL